MQEIQNEIWCYYTFNCEKFNVQTRCILSFYTRNGLKYPQKYAKTYFEIRMYSGISSNIKHNFPLKILTHLITVFKWKKKDLINEIKGKKKTVTKINEFIS